MITPGNVGCHDPPFVEVIREDQGALQNLEGMPTWRRHPNNFDQIIRSYQLA